MEEIQQVDWKREENIYRKALRVLNVEFIINKFLKERN
jgi:hypothetical protein